MSYLRTPGLGPIIGHTTDKTCRIWIRAGDPGDSSSTLDSERRTIGVLGVLKNEKQVDPNRIYYFRLHREFDRTGTFVVGEQQSLVSLSDNQPSFVQRLIVLPSSMPGRNDLGNPSFVVSVPDSLKTFLYLLQS